MGRERFNIYDPTNEEISLVLNIDCIKKRFVESGMDKILNGGEESCMCVKKNELAFEAYFLALSCSDPREGFRNL